MKKIVYLILTMQCIMSFLLTGNIWSQVLNPVINGTTMLMGDYFYTDYFTTFGHTTQSGNNLIEDAEGNVHIAWIDNYRLWYFKSSNNGESWSIRRLTTGHEGDIFYATLVVDHNGKVFIAFTCNDYFDYGNPTSVSYGYEFYYDLYCIHNLSESWTVETIDKPTRSGLSDNYGAVISAMSVDSNNDIHVYTQRAGFWTYGGEAWEWIRSSSQGSWGSRMDIVEFNDMPVDRFIHPKFIPLIDKQGNVTLIMSRMAPTGDALFYVRNEGSGWSSPTILTEAVAYAWNRYDAVIDGNDHVYMAYMQEKSPDLYEIHLSKDFAAASPIQLNLTDQDTITNFFMHSNESGDMTLALYRRGYNASLCFSPDGANWSGPYEVSDQDKKYLSGINFVRTDTRSNIFADCKQLAWTAGQRDEEPYGPDSLHFATITLAPNSLVDKNFKILDFSLSQNYPNPFNPNTMINYQLPMSSAVELSIYNLLGQRVATLVNERKSAGHHKVEWDASGYSSGIYYYQFKAGEYQDLKKMILIK
jgi:hypothetical protein